MGQTTRKETAEVAPGTVVSQNPPPKKKVDKEQAVDLVVASAVLIPVPNLHGRTQRQAGADLDKAGFVLGRSTTKVDNDVGPGIVIDQRPEAGAKAAIRSSVDVTISSRDVTEVPNVVGESADRALARLATAGFTVGKQERRETSEAAPGVVLSQHPAAKTRARHGEAINLVLAARPKDEIPIPAKPRPQPTTIDSLKPPIVLNPEHGSRIPQPYVLPWAFQWAPGRPNEKASYEITLGRVGMTKEYKTTTTRLTWDPKLCGVAGPAASGWWLRVKATREDGASAETEHFFSVVPPVDFDEYCRGCPTHPSCASRPGSSTKSRSAS